jgi:hypothetical protein
LSVAGALRPCRCTDGDPTPQNPAERGGRVNVHTPPASGAKAIASQVPHGRANRHRANRRPERQRPCGLRHGVGDSRREDSGHEPGDHAGVLVRQACWETALPCPSRHHLTVPPIWLSGAIGVQAALPGFARSTGPQANRRRPCPYPYSYGRLCLTTPPYCGYQTKVARPETRCLPVARREPAPSRQVGSLVHFFLVYRLLRRQLSSRSSTTLGAEAPTVLRYAVSSVHIDVIVSPRGPRRLRPRAGV